MKRRLVPLVLFWLLFISTGKPPACSTYLISFSDGDELSHYLLAFFLFLSNWFFLLQARILALNGSYFLKAGGHFVISIKANCIDSTVPAEAVFQSEVKKLQQEQFKPFEQVTLEPFERDHACVVGGYRMPKKQKAAA